MKRRYENDDHWSANNADSWSRDGPEYAPRDNHNNRSFDYPNRHEDYPNRHEDNGDFKRYRPNRGPYQPPQPQLSAIEKTTYGVCKDINKICEGCEIEDIVKYLNHISIPIAAEFGKEDFFRSSCLTTIFTTLTEQPQKLLYLSCLVQIANAKNQVIGKFVLEFFHQKCLDLLSGTILSAVEEQQANDEHGVFFGRDSNNTGPFNKFKLVMRFFATLTPIIKKESVLAIYEQTLDAAIELQKSFGEKRCPLAEQLYSNLLISIPYFMVFNSDDAEFKAAIKSQIIDKASSFPIVKDEFENMVTPFVSELNKGSSYESQNIVECALPALKELEAEDYASIKEKLMINFENLIKPNIRDSLNGAELEVNVLPKLAFPSTQLLTKIAMLDDGVGKIDSLWRYPRLLIHVLPKNEEYETMPSSTSYIGLLMKDIVQDILEGLEFNKGMASKELLALGSFFKPGLFAPLNSSLRDLDTTNDYNKTVDAAEQKSTWAVEDVIVENVLSLAFNLPEPQTRPIYYYNVLVFACQAAPAGVAPRFGKAMRFLFNSISQLDCELRIRFLDWMSLQLSNFKFKWKWQEWRELSEQLNDSQYNVTKTFLKNLVFQEVRLSSKETIRESFTEDQFEEFGKYLNVSILDTVEKIHRYDASVYGREVITESSAESLEYTKTVEQPVLKFTEHPSLPYFDEASELVKLVQDSSEFGAQFGEFYEKLWAKIEADESLANTSSKTNFLLNLVFQTVCYCNSRSVSHFETFVTDNLSKMKVLMKLPASREADADDDIDPEIQAANEMSLINAIMRYWNDLPQNGFIILEILIKLNLVSHQRTLDYLFGEDASGDTKDTCLVLTNSLATQIFLNIVTKNLNDEEFVQSLFKRFYEKFAALQNVEVEIPSMELLTTNLEEYENKWKLISLLGLYKTFIRKISGKTSVKLPPSEAQQAQEIGSSTRDIVTRWEKWI